MVRWSLSVAPFGYNLSGLLPDVLLGPFIRFRLLAEFVQDLCLSEVQKVVDTTKAKMRQAYRRQSKLEREKYSLDVDDKLYDRKYDSISNQLYQTFAELDELQEKIDDANAKLESIKRQGLSRDSIYESLRIFAKIYDKASDADKKAFLQSFIKSIELYPEKSRKNGCPIKAINFKFPVSYKGEAVYALNFPKPDGDTFTPPNLATGESIVLLTRNEREMED